jgi:hypothetical protein
MHQDQALVLMHYLNNVPTDGREIHTFCAAKFYHDGRLGAGDW